jgi:trimeric autotransporter adhesin
MILISEKGDIMKRSVLLGAFLTIWTMASLVSATEISQTPSNNPGLAIAVIQRTITYQGILKDHSGNPVPNNNYNVTFRIYDVAVGGPALWNSGEIQVATVDGYFMKELGPIALPFDKPYYLSIQISPDPEMIARQKITMTAYSASSDTANYAFASAGGGSGSNWNISSNNVLFTNDYWGIAKGNAGNTVRGDSARTMVNLGSYSYTGSFGNQSYCTVGGGSANMASLSNSTVGGGKNNMAFGLGSVISGGVSDTAEGSYSGVASGLFNRAGDGVGDTAAFVGGGWQNSVTAGFGTICGGGQNEVNGRGGIIGGGGDNTAGEFSFVGGGGYNFGTGTNSAIAGGSGNNASGYSSTVSGGDGNHASGPMSAITGGSENQALGDTSFIGGGSQNYVYGRNSVVVGGSINSSSGNYAFVGGGTNNRAAGLSAAVGGGQGNTADSAYSYVGGGIYNRALGNESSVLGGYDNKVQGDYSIIGGGFENYNAGAYSCIPGGYADTITSIADYSMAFGRGINLASSYRFYLFNTDYPGRFSLNRDSRDGGAAYPIHVGTGTTNGNGAYLTTGGVWTNGSSRTFKENFTPFNDSELLFKIANLSITTYNYKGTTEKHIGPVAEEFVGAFDTGVIRETDGKRDDMYLSSSDVAGVALAGVQELLKQNKELKTENENIKTKIAALEKRMAELEKH